MGKYALENYERYKAYKVRPKPLSTAPNNRGRGQFQMVIARWKDLEPGRGEYDLNDLHKSIAMATNPVLMIDTEVPTWVTKQVSECFASFIRKIGSNLEGNDQLEGIVITTVESCHSEWDAYLDAFCKIPIFADLHNRELIQYLTIRKLSYGLIVRCSEANWIQCCEMFAEQNLQETWKKKPVLLHIEDSYAGIQISRQALAWHASMANIKMDLGYSFTLRRLTYPKIVSSNGALPLRFWFVNSGSAPCYRDFKIRIRLHQGMYQYEIPLQANAKDWLIGDITYHEIVKLPDMVPGRYQLSLGIFFNDDTPMQLTMDCIENNGYYELGSIEVDTIEREEYFHIWDDYYPEGYYPLEDPKSPKEVDL